LTRRLILQKARRHPSRLRRIVSTRFQVLFHSPPGVLFTFPSRYLSAIGHRLVFRLTRWSWQIHTGLHGPGPTREQHQRHAGVSSTGVTPSTPSHSPRLRLPPHVHAGPPADDPHASHNPQPATPAG